MTTYNKEHYQKNKEKIDAWNKKWAAKNKDKVLAYHRQWYRDNREKILATCKTSQKDNRRKNNHAAYLRQKDTDAFKQRKAKDRALYKERHPLRFKLSKLLSNIRQRCKNPDNKSYRWYGGRGIKCFLTIDDLVFLWKRYHAQDMHKPSVDRIDNWGNYQLDNCRFIEMEENLKRRYE